MKPSQPQPTPFGDFYIQDGIGFLTIREDLQDHMSIPEIIEHYDIIDAMTFGKKVPILIDVNKANAFIMELQARKLVLAKYDANASCYAFVSENVGTTFFINLFFKIAPTRIPMKIFGQTSSALDWIQQFKQESTMLEEKSA